VGREFQGRVTFAQVDVSSSPELVSQYTIDGIPTLVFFRKGQEIHRTKGIVMRDKLRLQVQGVLVVSGVAGKEDE
jgi:thioredoxin 1